MHRPAAGRPLSGGHSGGRAARAGGRAAQGLDISQAMLDVAVEREVEGDVAVADMGQGLPLRGGAFDGAISISAVQVVATAPPHSVLQCADLAPSSGVRLGDAQRRKSSCRVACHLVASICR